MQSRGTPACGGAVPPEGRRTSARLGRGSRRPAFEVPVGLEHHVRVDRQLGDDLLGSRQLVRPRSTRSVQGHAAAYAAKGIAPGGPRPAIRRRGRNPMAAHPHVGRGPDRAAIPPACRREPFRSSGARTSLIRSTRHDHLCPPSRCRSPRPGLIRGGGHWERNTAARLQKFVIHRRRDVARLRPRPRR